MNIEIKKLMCEHRIPDGIQTMFGLEIQRVAEEYAEQFKPKFPTDEEIKKASYIEYIGMQSELEFRTAFNCGVNWLKSKLGV